MVIVSPSEISISSSLINFNHLDHQGSWLSKYSATVVVGVAVAVATVVWRNAWIRRKKHGWIQEVKNTKKGKPSEEPKLKCYCGLPAKLRMSKTFENPYRLFYSCSRNSRHHPCKFFHWSNEISVSKEGTRKEVNYLRYECIQLHKKALYSQAQQEKDRALWDVERSALRSKLSCLRANLNDIERRIQPLYETDNMPPVNESCITDENEDGAKVIEAM